MIISNIAGGLGNQLFQFALGKQLAVLNNTELKLDIKGFKNYFRSFQLNSFDIPIQIATDANISNCNDIYEAESFIFDPSILTRGDNIRLQGYWQTERYFKNIERVLKENLRPKLDPNIPYIENKIVAAKMMIQRLQPCISVHFRRSDYLTISDVSGICDDSYYQRAKEYICSKVKNPIFIYFSDDVEWLNSEYKKLSSDGYVIFPTDPVNDLLIMSYCSHNIIANSTFSWWGAWLNDNPDKIVVAPEKWHNRLPTPDIYPESWVKV